MLGNMKFISRVEQRLLSSCSYYPLSYRVNDASRYLPPKMDGTARDKVPDKRS